MDVTDVLRDRMQPPDGLQRMVAVSILLHAAAVLLLWLAPARWLASSEAPRTVMTISLGTGGEGPQSGGMTAAGGRPVQAPTPPDEPPKREAPRPPAARAPDMTMPLPRAKPTRAAPPVKVANAPDQARGRTPTRGPETRSGSAMAETGARGQGFGLSTGGGPGSGSRLDVGDFCCPDYLVTMLDRIRGNWDQRAETPGVVIVRFTIERDGRLTQVGVEESSGNPLLDNASLRAVLITRQLPPLPAQFPNPTLTVHLNFQYQR